MSNESQPYYFVVASHAFMEAEPLDEVLEERIRHYGEKGKAIDFFYVVQPAFLESPAFSDLKARLELPAAAVISTDPQFIRWLQLRLTLVSMGEFVAPSDFIPDPLASLAS